MQTIFDIENFNGEVFEHEDLSKHTTYKIGGSAKYFVIVNDIDSLKNILELVNSKNIPFEIIGGGSNMLVSDNGYDGLIIKLSGLFQSINFDEETMLCNCGAACTLRNILNEYFNNSYKGIKFLSGIPGTLGGAVKMNAGRKNDWISKAIHSVTVLDSDLSIKEYLASKLDWSYRKSSFKENQIILSAKLKFEFAITEDLENSKKIVEEYNLTRKETQPIDKLCCGSVFKNPTDYSAGKLVEEVGLKSFSIGDAEVSAKHANFIINKGNASANDVVALIQKIQQDVFDKFDIKLYPEVKFLGFNEKCSLF